MMTKQYLAPVLDALKERFSKFASHKPGTEASYFRFLASNARDQGRACAETAIWDVVADFMEVELQPYERVIAAAVAVKQEANQLAEQGYQLESGDSKTWAEFSEAVEALLGGLNNG